MSKSILRTKEIIELFLTYFLCFIGNMLFNYFYQIDIKNNLIYSFFMGFYENKNEFYIFFSLFAGLLQYFIILKKKKEVSIRLLVGATIKNIRLLYFSTCFIFQIISYILITVINSILYIEVTDNFIINIYFLLYTVISMLFIRERFD